jgi:hypothetical protein
LPMPTSSAIRRRGAAGEAPSVGNKLVGPWFKGELGGRPERACATAKRQAHRISQQCRFRLNRRRRIAGRSKRAGSTGRVRTLDRGRRYRSRRPRGGGEPESHPGRR